MKLFLVYDSGMFFKYSLTIKCGYWDHFIKGKVWSGNTEIARDIVTSRRKKILTHKIPVSKSGYLLKCCEHKSCIPHKEVDLRELWTVQRKSCLQ